MFYVLKTGEDAFIWQFIVWSWILRVYLSILEKVKDKISEQFRSEIKQITKFWNTSQNQSMIKAFLPVEINDRIQNEFEEYESLKS